uniref:Protein BUD31 homolog n=1 Tax=Marmota marmota marmota TaxID=9994 RepID=A0A8C5ZCN0_MARMA
MPKIKRSRKAPPDGWELIEPTLDELDQKMRERKAISRELYKYCIKEGYADKNLIAKWKKQGYENLCCLRCNQTRDTKKKLTLFLEPHTPNKTASQEKPSEPQLPPPASHKPLSPSPASLHLPQSSCS